MNRIVLWAIAVCLLFVADYFSVGLFLDAQHPVLRRAMTGQYGDDDGHASTVVSDLYGTRDEELIEIAQNFFPMIADTITRLARTAS